jgi:hypothetical protein
MEEQMDEIISEKTITSDEEIYFEDANFDKEWEDIINPDESVSQISRASSETSSLIAENSVWNGITLTKIHLMHEDLMFVKNVYADINYQQV